MHFAESGIDIHPLVPPLVSFLISYFTSMAGVSGAFMLLPFQVSVLGFTSPAVSSTNHLYNIVATPGGVYRYLREGRMVWPLAWAVILGTLPGVVGGAVIRVRCLPDPRSFRVFVALVLLFIGARMVADLLGSGAAGPGAPAGTAMEPIRSPAFNWRRITYTFGGTTHEASTPGIFLLSLIVGVIGGAYGIGGGSLIAPFFVSIFGLPVHTVAGAALMGTFVTSVAGVASYQIIAHLSPDLAAGPDWLLGLLFGIGGLAGTYLGARTQRFMPARVIKGILVFCILFLVVKYLGAAG
jgi:uncharacterized membrane protein YfcA